MKGVQTRNGDMRLLFAARSWLLAAVHVCLQWTRAFLQQLQPSIVQLGDPAAAQALLLQQHQAASRIDRLNKSALQR